MDIFAKTFEIHTIQAIQVNQTDEYKKEKKFKIQSVSDLSKSHWLPHSSDLSKTWILLLKIQNTHSPSDLGKSDRLIQKRKKISNTHCK